MVPPARWHELEDKLARAPSLRAFFYEAIKRPQDGGYYYGTNVLEMCEQLEKADASASERRRQALDQLRQRCDFSEQERKDAEREFSAIRGSKLRDDALHSVIVGFLLAKTPEARTAVMQASIELGNPMVTATLASLSIEAASHKAGVKTPPDFPNAAIFLTACRLGADCGPDSMLLLEMCATMGWCGASLPEALREKIGADYATLDRLSQQAVADIRKGELTRLVRQP